jgi:hypothetical protein
MTESTTTQFRREGDAAFPTESENDTHASPSDAENEGTEGSSSSEGAGKTTQTPDEKDIPFHQHPRWVEREEAWKNRFNESEARHQEDLRKIREEFSTARETNKENTEIPKWFGGNQEQWDEFRKFEDERIKTAQETAVRQIEEKQQQETKLVEEATTFMQSELEVIQADKTLNPTGEKVDPNKLLRYTLEGNYIDPYGRWNYRRAYRDMMRDEELERLKNPKGNRKNIAGATTSESRAETRSTSFKTPADFKKSRPW